MKEWMWNIINISERRAICKISCNFVMTPNVENAKIDFHILLYPRVFSRIVIVNINILFVCIYEMVVKNYSKFVLKIHIRSICNKIRVRKFNVNFFKIKPYVLLKMFFEFVRFKLTVTSARVFSRWLLMKLILCNLFEWKASEIDNYLLEKPST